MLQANNLNQSRFSFSSPQLSHFRPIRIDLSSLVEVGEIETVYFFILSYTPPKNVYKYKPFPVRPQNVDKELIQKST